MKEYSTILSKFKYGTSLPKFIDHTVQCFLANTICLCLTTISALEVNKKKKNTKTHAHTLTFKFYSQNVYQKKKIIFDYNGNSCIVITCSRHIYNLKMMPLE